MFRTFFQMRRVRKLSFGKEIEVKKKIIEEKPLQAEVREQRSGSGTFASVLPRSGSAAERKLSQNGGMEALWTR